MNDFGGFGQGRSNLSCVDTSTNNEMRRLDTMDLLLNVKSKKFYYKVILMTKLLHTDVPTND